MKNKVIDASKGQLIISENFVIARQTKSEELIDFFGRDKVKVVDIKNGYIHYNVSEVSVNDTHFSFNFIYNTSQLETILWGFDYPSDDTWENWSEEKELKREEKYNNWLTQQIGTSRNFTWGSIWVSFDRKGGWSGMGLRYS